MKKIEELTIALKKYHEWGLPPPFNPHYGKSDAPPLGLDHGKSDAEGEPDAEGE